MAQHAFAGSLSVVVPCQGRFLRLALLCMAFASSAAAQTPQQQYVFGSVPLTTATSQVAVYAKNGQNGALSAIPGSPFPDSLPGGAIAIDGLGHFLFVTNATTNNISMFQIDPTSGSLTQVPGSPFASGPTENPNMAARSPVCLAAENSGQFLYVGYSFGNFTNFSAINAYAIDSANLQLIPLTAQPTTDIASSPIGMLTDSKGLHLYVGLGVNPWTGMQDAGTNVYSIDPVTGALGLQGTAGNAIVDGRSIAIDPQGRFFFDGWGANVGTIDSALISPADGTALTGISSVSSGTQIPVAMLTDGSGKFLYVQQSFESVVYSINQTTGALATPPTVLAVLNFSLGTAAADPLGPYIYSLQHDGVHGFLVDSQSGVLSEIPGSPFRGSAAQGAVVVSGTPSQAVSGPVAALFPASENFGSITVGQSSGAKLITLTNTGDQSLSVNSISVTGSNASDFSATPNCSLPTVFTPNTTCSISVVFSPTAAGTRQASLAASDNAPGSPQSVPLSGTGASPLPGVTLAPGALTFAITTQGSTSVAQTINVASTGPATLHISSVLVSGANPADFTLNNTCSGAYPGGSACTISVTFSPFGSGQRAANITINDDAPNSPQSVQLTGTGATPPPGTPVVRLSSNGLSFGAVTQGTSISPGTITLTNSGTGSLHITSVTLGGTNAGDFTLANNCVAAAYAVGASCTISASLSPLVTGQRSAFLSVADDAPNSPQVISLSATVNAALSISPASIGSTSITVTPGQTATFTLQLTPGPGFSGSASFACAGAPAATTCAAPNVQISGAPISYTVSVATTANSMLVLPRTIPQFPIALRLMAWYGFACVLLYIFRLRRAFTGAGLLRVAALALVATVCLFESAGCGGGAAGASPQTLPALQTGGTPQGTSTITVTPSVKTSTGTPLSGVPPIQLTLTVQ